MTTTSQSRARAAISDRWPRAARPSSARARSAPGAARGQRGAQLGDRAHVLMPPPPRRGGQRPRRARRARRTAPSSSGVRSATASRCAATVASSPRATGPVSARAGPCAAQFSTVARTSGTSGSRVDAGRGGQALGRGLQRDQEVGGDRRGGVVGGAVLVGDLERAPCPGARRVRSRDRERARRAAGDRGAPRPQSAGPVRRSPSSAGAARSASWGAEARRARALRSSGRPGGAGRELAAARGDLGVGHAQQHDVEPRRAVAAERRRHGDPAPQRVAQRVPSRPRPMTAKRARQWAVSVSVASVPVPASGYRSASCRDTVSNALVRPLR